MEEERPHTCLRTSKSTVFVVIVPVGLMTGKGSGAPLGAVSKKVLQLSLLIRCQPVEANPALTHARCGTPTESMDIKRGPLNDRNILDDGGRNSVKVDRVIPNEHVGLFPFSPLTFMLNIPKHKPPDAHIQQLPHACRCRQHGNISPVSGAVPGMLTSLVHHGRKDSHLRIARKPGRVFPTAKTPIEETVIII